jgi:hypothetical protein
LGSVLSLTEKVAHQLVNINDKNRKHPSESYEVTTNYYKYNIYFQKTISVAGNAEGQLLTEI